MRIDVRRTETLKQGGESYGNHTKCKVVKNKVAPPFRLAEFDIVFGKGICKLSEIIELGIELGYLEKSGAWISYEGQRIGQGREKAKAFLEEHPEIANEIEGKIRARAKEEDIVPRDPVNAILQDPDDLEAQLKDGDAEEGDFDISVLI